MALKVKGANRKTKNAKQVAGKEEEKAQGAMSDKKRHLESERKMRKERTMPWQRYRSSQNWLKTSAPNCPLSDLANHTSERPKAPSSTSLLLSFPWSC